MATKLNTVNNTDRKSHAQHHMMRQDHIAYRSEHNITMPGIDHAKFLQTSPDLLTGPVARPTYSYTGGSPALVQTQVPVPSHGAARANHPAVSMELLVPQSTSDACSTDAVVANPTTGKAANYKDYSRVPPDAGNNEGVLNKSTSEKDESFPVILHRMLSVLDHEELITWMPHGRTWRVVKPKAFEAKLIPLYFRHTKYASFMRQVNGWGFKRVTQGPDQNSYYHELFLRGLPQLCNKMQRPSKAKRGTSSTASEPSMVDPDFTRLSLIAPLPSAGGAPLAPQQQHQLAPTPPHHQISLPLQYHQLAPSPQHHQYPRVYVTSTSVEGSGEGSGSGSGESGPYGSGYTGNADYGGCDDGGGSSGEDKVAAPVALEESNPIFDTNRQLSNGVTFSSTSSEYAGGSEGGGDSSSDSGAGSSEDGGSRQNQQKELSRSSPDRDINQNNHVYPVMGGVPMLPKQAMHPSSEAPGNMPCIVVQQPQGGNQPQQMMFQQQPQMVRVVNQHGEELGYMQSPSNQGGFPNQMFQNSAMMQGQNPQYMQGQMLQGMPQAAFMPQATMQQQYMMQNQAIPQHIVMQHIVMHNQAVQQQQHMQLHHQAMQQQQHMQQQPRLHNQAMQQQQHMQQQPRLHNQAMQQQQHMQQQPRLHHQAMQQKQHMQHQPQKLHNQAMQQQQPPQAAPQQLFHPQMMRAPGSGQPFHTMGTVAFSPMIHNDYQAVTQPPRQSQKQEQ